MLATVTTTDDCYPIVGEPGFFLDSWGFRFYSPTDAAADVDQARERLALLLADVPPPFIGSAQVGGKWPTQNQVDTIRRELDKLPADVLDDLRRDGWHAEVIRGADGRRHPRAPVFTAIGPPCGGWCSFLHRMLVVAAEANIVTTLHEAGHAIDGKGRQYSRSRCWSSSVGQADSDGERFAEMFALHFHSPATRAKLSANVRRFFEVLFQ